VATNSLTLTDAATGWATDILVDTIAVYVRWIPKPVIRAAVRTVFAWASEIDRETVVAILEGIGAPVSLAGQVLRDFFAQAEPTRRRASRTSQEIDVRCPDSGNVVSLSKGAGEYTCPFCERDIVVSKGKATHAKPLKVRCPESRDAITLLHGDGEYPCPDCRQDIEVLDGVAVHAALVTCPTSGDDVWVGPEAGEYDCPECDADITVDEEGDAEHA
jgi:Zn finger protein HypA/HybF involved in hydrogenase expression